MPRKPEPPKPPQQPKAEPQSGGRRIRQPKWTNLHPTIAHLYTETDERLTYALEATGDGLQETFEAVINTYCGDAATHPRGHARGRRHQAAARPQPVAARHTSRPGHREACVVRLKRNTRARLVAACKQEQMGGKAIVNDAIEAYLDELAVDRSS